MVVTRGPYYLRFYHADKEERESDVLDFYDKAIIQELRGEYYNVQFLNTDVLYYKAQQSECTHPLFQY